MLLVSSSFVITFYHCFFIPGDFLMRCFLVLSMLLGLGFIVLQFYELWVCCCDITFGSYYASCFCTVGLHLLHVLVGLVGLLYIYFKDCVISRYHFDVIVWYWHFVDYI